MMIQIINNSHPLILRASQGNRGIDIKVIRATFNNLSQNNARRRMRQGIAITGTIRGISMKSKIVKDTYIAASLKNFIVVSKLILASGAGLLLIPNRLNGL